MHQLKCIFIVFGSLKAVGMYPFYNFVSIASKKKIAILDYCWRVPLLSTEKGVRQGAGSYKLNCCREAVWDCAVEIGMSR